MLVRSTVALAAIALPVFAGSIYRQNPIKVRDDDDCPPAFIVCIRGTLEDPGCGEIGKVADAVVKEIPGTEIQAVVYPASGIDDKVDPPEWNLFKYINSVTQGTRALEADISVFNAYCPDTPIAVLGYSQGAQAVGNVMCGNEGIFPPNAPLEKETADAVKAIVQLGDPTNRKNDIIPWHKGNGSVVSGGIFPRSDESLANCRQYGDHWQSWCDKGSNGIGDLFCAHGTNIQIHKEYVINHGKEITDFVVSKLKAAIPKKPKSKSKSITIDIDFELK